MSYLEGTKVCKLNNVRTANRGSVVTKGMGYLKCVPKRIGMVHHWALDGDTTCEISEAMHLARQTGQNGQSSRVRRWGFMSVLWWSNGRTPTPAISQDRGMFRPWKYASGSRPFQSSKAVTISSAQL